MPQEILSDEQIKLIDERCTSATPGPWLSYVEGRDFESGSSVIVRGENGQESDLYLLGGTIADQDFIAHARQDIPLLLDEIKRLRKLLAYNPGGGDVR